MLFCKSGLSWHFILFMVFIDLIFIVILGYGCIRGLWNGFLIEFASLVSLLIGIYIAIKFSFILKEIVGSHVSWSPQTLQVIAFILTFILVIVGITVLAKSLTKIANLTPLGLFNKAAGGILGIIKTILILSFILNVFQKMNGNFAFADKKTLAKSLLYYPIIEIAGIVYPSVENWFMEIKESESDKK